ncbi:MAG TPA: multicopper oxidase domain-containing protein [Bryobacteraceae bacterium]|nr:multicopper oxidase domain-containing protein [Bryobacteraceae bacterium]
MPDSTDSKLTVTELIRTPGDSRRGFVGLLVTAASTLAASRILDAPIVEAAEKDATICVASCVAPGSPGATNCGLDLETIGEITRDSNGLLQGLLIATAENRSIPYANGPAYDCRITPLRAYVGYQGFTEDPANLRTKPPVHTPGGLTRLARPGPTLRARLGDKIEIIFLNRIDEKKFFNTTTRNACDMVQGVTTTGTMPNCIHGGNTTNLHFHGTHVSPSRFADNVLIQVLPDKDAKPEWVKNLPFLRGDTGKDPSSDPQFQAWKATSEKRLESKVKDLKGVDEQLEKENEWPEYWLGAYPYTFVLPKWVKDGPFKMGQAPGTHWYHAHKHGAAATQMLNGMSGAFIIEGDYDTELRATFPGLQEKILVVQQYDSVPNLQRSSSNGLPPIQINGQLQPTIKMQPGEIQLWRLINATVQAPNINTFFFVEAASAPPPGGAPTVVPVAQRGTVPAFRTIAVDGVQFAWENYNRRKADTEFQMSLGNRIDILVQAPMLTDGKPKDMVLMFAAVGAGQPPPSPQNTMLRVRVEGEPKRMDWPQQWEPDPNDPSKPRGKYLTFPEFLADLPPVTGPQREVVFGANSAGQLTINGKQFQDGVVDECMSLNTIEEWKISNEKSANNGGFHPFHIHVNPFQIIEINDGTTTTRLPQPYIWRDTIALPPGGYVITRSRFVDFTGKFVLHCHILAHEDIGMMQMVEVREGTCPATPYHTAATHGH